MIIINEGLPDKLKRSAAELFLEALSEKFIPILGRKDKAKRLIESSFEPGNCFYAEEDGKLLGLLAFQTIEGSFLNPSLKVLIPIYGILKAIIKAINLSMLRHKTKTGEFYIEAIAVTEFTRGKGIGTKLIETMTEFAMNNEYNCLTLQVIDTNPRAKELYEKLGFSVIKNSKIWPVNKLIGWPFCEVFLMEKLLLS
jgi:ribosomal protein S18 acetylase RimI-like enzyme